jgi:hypothetical protein
MTPAAPAAVPVLAPAQRRPGRGIVSRRCAGVDAGASADQLQKVGADAFAQSRDELMTCIAAEGDTLADALTTL